MKLDSNSTSEGIITRFDYEILSPQQRNVIQKCTGEIKERLRRTAQDVWEVGQKLVEVRSQLEHGQFEVWLSAEFGWSRRTAYNFINVYDAFGESTNFARLDIATSALYKLAAPSTPSSVRQEFLDKAEKGEKITHKEISQALNTIKNSSIVTKSQQISSPSPKILQVIPKDSLELELKRLNDNLAHQPKTSSQSVMAQTQVEIKSGCWYLFDLINVLFCGDTALTKFFQRAPEATLALAVTSDDWDHDWLIEKADNLVVLKESYLKEGTSEQIISLFSAEGDTIILPWLPKAEMLAIAHRLKRRIVAGDPSPERCQKAIEQLGLNVEQIRL
ncbi:MAG: DUF3102 domain-containing protein [Xenococcaceae cyanobacterium MO_188.B32]|nr:DUF3102 domain-containing protein [Xenococcaceae cyanobacterium MO_188.B32]